MYCQKCNSEFQDTAAGICPSCGQAVEKSLYLDGAVKIDDNSIIVEEALPPAARGRAPGAAGPKTAAHTRAGGKNTRQPRSLDQMEDSIQSDGGRPRAGGAKSLAISVMIGAFLLFGVIVGGLFKLRYHDAADDDGQGPEKTLALPPASAPAPTFRKKPADSTPQASATAPAAAEQPAGRAIEPEVPALPPRTPPPPAAASSAPEPAPQQVSAAPAKARPAAVPAAPPAAKNGLFIVLCGSFQDRSKAYRIADQMQKNQLAAFVEEADLGQRGIWYRVKIGGLQTRQEAEQARSEIKKKFKIEGIVSAKK